MAIGTNDKNELVNEIKKILELLSRPGQPFHGISKEQKNELAVRVAEKITNDPDTALTLEDVKSRKEIRQALALCCMAETIPQNKLNDPKLSFDYSILFRPRHNVDEKDLKNEINKVLKQLLQDKNLTEREQEHIENISLKLAANMLRERDKFTLAENLNALNVIAAATDLLAPSLRQKYGVAQPGEVFIAQQSMPLINQLSPDVVEEGTSFAAEVSKVDIGLPDPLGIIFYNLINAAQTDIPNEMESELAQHNILINSPQPNNPIKAH